MALAPTHRADDTRIQGKRLVQVRVSFKEMIRPWAGKRSNPQRNDRPEFNALAIAPTQHAKRNGPRRLILRFCRRQASSRRSMERPGPAAGTLLIVVFS